MELPIPEPVTVVCISANPTFMRWRQRKYTFTACGLHYTTHEGSTLIHLFTMTTEGAWFKLRLDTRSLQWTLVETESI